MTTYKVVQLEYNIVQFCFKVLFNMFKNITQNITYKIWLNFEHCVKRCVQLCTTWLKKVVQLIEKGLNEELYGITSTLYNTLYNKLSIIAHYCTICTILHKTLYNFVFKPIFQLYNFSTCFVCTTFCTILYNMCTILCNIVQVVQVVQPFVQYCNGLVCRSTRCKSQSKMLTKRKSGMWCFQNSLFWLWVCPTTFYTGTLKTMPFFRYV